MADTWIWIFTLANLCIFVSSFTVMRWSMNAATRELDRAHEQISKLLDAAERVVDHEPTRIPHEGKVS